MSVLLVRSSVDEIIIGQVAVPITQAGSWLESSYMHTTLPPQKIYPHFIQSLMYAVREMFTSLWISKGAI